MTDSNDQTISTRHIQVTEKGPHGGILVTDHSLDQMLAPCKKCGKRDWRLGAVEVLKDLSPHIVASCMACDHQVWVRIEGIEPIPMGDTSATDGAPEACAYCHGPNDHGEECRYVIGDRAPMPLRLPPTGRA